MPFPGVVNLDTLFTHGDNVLWLHTNPKLQEEDRDVAAIAEQVGSDGHFRIDASDSCSLTFKSPNAGQIERPEYPERNTLRDQSLEALSTYSLSDVITGDPNGEIHDFGPLHETHALIGGTQVKEILGEKPGTTIAVQTSASDDQDIVAAYLCAKALHDIAKSPVAVVKMDDYGRQEARLFCEVPTLEAIVRSRRHEVALDTERERRVAETTGNIETAREIFQQNERGLAQLEQNSQLFQQRLAATRQVLLRLQDLTANPRRAA